MSEEKFQRHHKYWPRKNYINRGKLVRLFRNLPCNIELLTAKEHRAIHSKYRETPGGMPTYNFMAQQIADCYSRGCTKSNCKIAVGKVDRIEDEHL